MKSFKHVIVVLIMLAFAPQSPAGGVTVTVNGQDAGPTPFISLLDVTLSNASALKSVQFTIEPKPQSVSRPISVTYSGAYLQQRGYLDTETGHLTVPVFGLYADYNNTVAMKYKFKGSSFKDTIMISTPAFEDPTGAYTNPTILQARMPKAKLSYDFMMLKNYGSEYAPIIIDTDAEVRWVGPAGAAGVEGVSSSSAMLYENSIYMSDITSIVRLEFDGSFSFVGDYADMDVTMIHHNFDSGKNGILVEVDTQTTTESVIIEIDGSGNVLKTWNLADIISSAMTADGDDPSAFVRLPDDWFHSNAATYQKSDDSLIVSSRENFVIALDYETGAIKWILGDSTKAWYQYPSLRKYALALDKDTLPPIGQHAVSVIKNNNLLLFDNGANSLEHDPAGENRTYSTPRKYKINTKKMTAKEVWDYPRDESVTSPYCSSVYEDRKKNYLIGYSVGGPFIFTEIVGVNSRDEIVFDYSYPAMNGCGTAFNSTIVHLENMTFE